MPKFSPKTANFFVTSIVAIGGFMFVDETSAQVPDNPDRIRQTTREILAQPEFALFPRIGKRGGSTRYVPTKTIGGVPRFQSARGQERQAAEETSPENQAETNRPGTRRIPRDVPPDAPDLDGPGNPENPQDALGNNDEFPEAGNLDGLRNGQIEDAGNNPAGIDPAENNPEPIQGADDLDNRPGNAARAPAREDLAARRGRDDAEKNEILRRHQNGPERIRNQTDALPAPRPRSNDGPPPSPTQETRTSELARVVGAIFHIVAWTILSIICGLIFWLIVKAIREFERPAAFAPLDASDGSLLDLAPAQAPGDVPADVYIAQARRLAEAGRYREAVAHLLLGAMSRVERAGWVRFRRGMTVRNYLQNVRQHPAAFEGFRSIVRVFEPLTFGRREPEPDHFEQSLAGYETGFGTE